MSSQRSIILASGSPRRREMLETLGYRLEVRVPDVDESALSEESIEETLIRVARLKAQAVGRPDDRVPILAADTVVVTEHATEGRVALGKPESPEQACSVLAELSGRTHRVLTGFVWMRGEATHSEVVDSEVTFRELDSEAIEAYVATGEPFDKAGGYGIQGKGAALVASVRGSFSNVVGLPLESVLACWPAADRS